MFHPHVLKRLVVIGVSSRALTATGKPVWSVRLASQTGQTSATAQHIDSLTMTTGNAKGKVMYSADLNTLVVPGKEVIVHQTTIATGTLNVRIGLIVQPKWEEPGNNTSMVLTA
jgi:hypothetical protein